MGLFVCLCLAYAALLGNDKIVVNKQKIYFENLPKNFEGKKIAVFSDVHCGAIVFKNTLKNAVEKIINEKPDIILFAGDLVSYKTSEAFEFADILKNLKAPLGVYSILGNHDYGDYSYWKTETEKKKNLDDLIKFNNDLGWKILLNENSKINISNDTIAIIGVENWGHIERFKRRGDIKKAYQGTEKIKFKILLSHDPSHWEKKVLKKYNDIDLTFSGHTHGFQFGIEIGNFKWSPSEYIYDLWDGLYKVNNQYLYVNRGLGNVGFSGRLGMWPEITIIELHKCIKIKK